MADHDPLSGPDLSGPDLSGLDDLARHGEHHSEPLPPEQIRRRGNRRRHRRHAGFAVAAVVAVVLGGGAVATGTSGFLGTLPPPVANSPEKPKVSTAPQVSAANLPTEPDLAWTDSAEWTAESTAPGAGEEAASRCFPESPETLEPTVLFRRDFTLAGAGSDNVATALSMQFASEESAAQAIETMSGWADDCAPRLKTDGYSRTQSGEWRTVDTTVGTATFLEVSSATKPESDEGIYTAYGLVQVDNRVTFVDMTTVMIDNNWAYGSDGTGLPQHPMFRSLPRVAERLAGAPAPTTSPSPTTAERRLTQENLIAAKDIPPRDRFTVEVMDPGVGRSVEEMSVCQPGDLTDLGADTHLSRNFKEQFEYGPGEQPDPDDPLKDLPDIYTAALQFPDADAAREAYDTYTQWVDECQTAIADDGYQVRDQGAPEWTTAPTDTGTAQFAEIVYAEPDGSLDEAGYFESIGLTLVEDRLMITVHLTYGQEHHVERDPEADQPHEQYALIKAAAASLQQ